MKTSTAVIGGIAAILGLVLVSKKVQAATNRCLIDGQTFNTYAELVQHYQTAHPGERIPISLKWS